MNRKVLLSILFVVVIVNFIAQIPYFIHEYHSFPGLRGSLLLGGVLIWFLVGFTWLWQQKQKGYIATLAFLIIEFVFYLSTQVTQFLSGHGALLYVLHPGDLVLFVVFGIGYVNLFVAGFYSVYLLLHKDVFLGDKQQ